ncbi:UNVERIFIED_CONTAM: hypothetical protein Slati_4480100 [Sesamum latifolium]|uniref:Uncharacterized protein n=1 Tax=Sesamum latifolium TaxID=2727402 RepID=A0AAW2SRQ8_9LAMI
MVWALSHLPWAIISVSQPDPETWFRGLQHSLDDRGFARALLICWNLWGARNKMLFESVSVSPQGLIEMMLGLEGSLIPTTRVILDLEGALKAYQRSSFQAVGVG